MVLQKEKIAENSIFFTPGLTNAENARKFKFGHFPLSKNAIWYDKDGFNLKAGQNFSKNQRLLYGEI